ncbi:MAG: putative DNA binding domain-containing protein [Clostridiales bacterium]|nr:putative DNA binding domain-containing protein [Clostridiales bacterium]
MIPLKLETLLEGRVVEQDRVEYKRGWNPSEVVTTICAYANDFSNINGGYLVIGIEEKYSQPMLPPTGIDENLLDKIQQELFQYCNFISPRYIPQTEIVQYQGRHVIYIWCSAGDDGPYSVPEDVLSKVKSDQHKEYWIKPSSVKTIAKGSELSELFNKFNSVPFDDRVNRQAKIEDIRRGYVEDFLVESNSALATEINKKTMQDMLIALEVANATDVGVDIRNIGLLMFADRPDKFLPGAHIELIRFHSKDAEGSDDFTEKVFTGPLQRQVREALGYINAITIEEKVIKYPDRAEADRFFNYPYSALEEVLVNAVFHKSYRIQEPVEIRVYVDCIKVINYPGPEKLIDMKELKAGRAVARRYRNRRIGEFLKEIDLSEKKSTGITKILRVLKANGSPMPEFETDDERNYLIVTIRPHEAFKAYEEIIESIEGINVVVNEGIVAVEGINEVVNEGIVAVEGINEVVNEGIAVDEGINEVVNEGIEVDEGINEVVNEGIAVDEGINEVVNEGIEVDEGINEVVNEGIEVDEGINEVVNEGIVAVEGINEVVNEGIVVDEGINEVVNEPASRQSQIINAVKRSPYITISQLSEWVGLSKTSVEREIKTMKATGVLQRIGSDKSGYWEANEVVNEGIEGLSDGINEVANEPVSRQSQIMNAVKRSPYITVSQLSEWMGLSIATLEREIKTMKKLGLIKRIGSNRSGYWEANDVANEVVNKGDEGINEVVNEE